MVRKESETIAFKKSIDESTTVEWKQSVAEIDEIIETAVAFANTEGAAGYSSEFPLRARS